MSDFLHPYSFAEILEPGHYPNLDKGYFFFDVRTITEWEDITSGILESDSIIGVGIKFGMKTDLTFIIDAICKKPTIHTLWICWKSEGEILEKQLNIIMRALNTSYITTFGISNSDIGDNETKIISKILKSNKTLTCFKIEHCIIYNEPISLPNQLILADAILSVCSLLNFENYPGDHYITHYDFPDEVMKRIEKKMDLNRHNKRMKEQTVWDLVSSLVNL